VWGEQVKGENRTSRGVKECQANSKGREKDKGTRQIPEQLILAILGGSGQSPMAKGVISEGRRCENPEVTAPTAKEKATEKQMNEGNPERKGTYPNQRRQARS